MSQNVHFKIHYTLLRINWKYIALLYAFGYKNHTISAKKEIYFHFYVRKNVIYNTFSNVKKEQPIFQGCPLILSNPTRQALKHWLGHR
jgi:hypothetical protein